MSDDNKPDKPNDDDWFPAERSAEPKPEETVKRTARRIVRVGVAALAFGFFTTFAGAVLLGNGPGQLEGAGNLVHRGGMFLMLGSLVVIVFGYRWESLSGFVTFAPADDPTTDLQELLRMLPPPPNATHGGAPPAPTYSSATWTPPMNDSSPVASSVASPPALTPAMSSDSPASPSSLVPPAGVPTNLPPNLPLNPPSAMSAGCLVFGWTTLGMFVLLALVPYLFDGSSVVHGLSLSFDSLLLIALIVVVVEFRGRTRAMALGAAAPLAFFLVAKGVELLVRPGLAPYGAGIFSATQFRRTDLIFHVILPFFALWGGFMQMTIDFFRQRRQPRNWKR